MTIKMIKYFLKVITNGLLNHFQNDLCLFITETVHFYNKYFRFELIFISYDTFEKVCGYSTITVFHVTTYNVVFIIEATITRQKLPPVSRREFYAHFSDWLVGNIITSLFPTEFANL